MRYRDELRECSSDPVTKQTHTLKEKVTEARNVQEQEEILNTHRNKTRRVLSQALYLNKTHTYTHTLEEKMIEVKSAQEQENTLDTHRNKTRRLYFGTCK